MSYHQSDMDMTMTAGLELLNDQNPRPHAPMHYSKTPVPHPCNYAAEKVDHKRVMREVLRAK
jgi:hypothetical protein